MDNIITWNIPNWITVVLMVVIGYAILCTVSAWWSNQKGGGA